MEETAGLATNSKAVTRACFRSNAAVAITHTPFIHGNIIEDSNAETTAAAGGAAAATGWCAGGGAKAANANCKEVGSVCINPYEQNKKVVKKMTMKICRSPKTVGPFGGFHF